MDVVQLTIVKIMLVQHYMSLQFIQGSVWDTLLC